MGEIENRLNDVKLAEINERLRAIVYQKLGTPFPLSPTDSTFDYSGITTTLTELTKGNLCAANIYNTPETE